MGKIIDTNQDVTNHIASLLADDVSDVIRYLSPIFPAGEKCVKEPEAQALSKAGIRLGLVCEGWGDFQTHGMDFPQISGAAGARDGKFCSGYAPRVGAPLNTCIYFAVDTDASAAQIHQFVLPYFAAIRLTFRNSGYRVGVYGSGAVCAAVIASGDADLAWLSQSMGWTNSREYLASKPPALVLHQGADQKLAGVDCDTNVALGDFGGFLPFTPSPPVAPVAPIMVQAAPVTSQETPLQKLEDEVVALEGKIEEMIDGEKKT